MIPNKKLKSNRSKWLSSVVTRYKIIDSRDIVMEHVQCTNTKSNLNQNKPYFVFLLTNSHGKWPLLSFKLHACFLTRPCPWVNFLLFCLFFEKFKLIRFGAHLVKLSCQWPLNRKTMTGDFSFLVYIQRSNTVFSSHDWLITRP